MISADTICSNAGKVWCKHVDGSWQDERAERVSDVDFLIERYWNDAFARIDTYISKITQVNFISQICDLQATYWPCQLGTYQSCQRLCPGTPLLNFWSRSSLSISISIYLCNIVFTRICHIFCAGSCHSKWQYPKPAGCERLHASVWSWGGELKRNNGCGPHLLHP